MKNKFKEFILYPAIIIIFLCLVFEINIDFLLATPWYKKFAKKHPNSRLLHLLEVWSS